MGLKDTLRDVIPADELTKLVQSYDIVGDIAILIVPEKLRNYEGTIAQAVLVTHRNVKTVLRRDGTYSGDFRLIPLTHIAGPKKTSTTCQEFGVKLRLDLSQVYYSVRLGSERKRIADLVGEGEEVLVMFSGVGPYPLMISRHSRARIITGIEINETAHRFALKNVELNRAKNVNLLCADVLDVLQKWGGTFDRIVMPLPHASESFLNSAIEVLNSPGTIHFYDFQRAGMFSEAAAKLERVLIAHGKIFRSRQVFVCGHNSPATYRICVDALID